MTTINRINLYDSSEKWIGPIRTLEYRISRNTDPVYSMGSPMPQMYSARNLSGKFEIKTDMARSIQTGQPLTIQVDYDNGQSIHLEDIFVFQIMEGLVLSTCSFALGRVVKSEKEPENNEEALRFLHQREI